MNIIDHLSLGVDSLANAKSFYTPVMTELDIDCLAVTDRFAAYGKSTVQFILMLPFNDERYAAGNGTHICFIASSAVQVDNFHQTALANGAQCEGKPGARPDYPTPDVYTAFVRDPFGHRLEAIYQGFFK